MRFPFFVFFWGGGRALPRFYIILTDMPHFLCCCEKSDDYVSTTYVGKCKKKEKRGRKVLLMQREAYQKANLPCKLTLTDKIFFLHAYCEPFRP